MNEKQGRRNGGFTLLELLAYIACLGTFLASVTVIYVTAARFNATGINAMERMRVAGQIRRAFLRDVREARSIAASAGRYATGGHELLVELPPQALEDGRRFVAYGMFDGQKRLGRHEFVVKTDDAIEYLRLTTFPLVLEGVRVSYDAANPRRVGLEIDVDRVGSRPIPEGFKRKPPDTYGMTATLRAHAPEGGSL